MAEASSIAKSRNESERLNAALISAVGLERRAKRRVVKVRMRSRCWRRVCASWLRYLRSRISAFSSTPTMQDSMTGRSAKLRRTSTCLPALPFGRSLARSRVGLSTPFGGAYGSMPTRTRGRPRGLPRSLDRGSALRWCTGEALYLVPRPIDKSAFCAWMVKGGFTHVQLNIVPVDDKVT